MKHTHRGTHTHTNQHTNWYTPPGSAESLDTIMNLLGAICFSSSDSRWWRWRRGRGQSGGPDITGQQQLEGNRSVETRATEVERKKKRKVCNTVWFLSLVHIHEGLDCFFFFCNLLDLLLKVVLKETFIYLLLIDGQITVRLLFF